MKKVAVIGGGIFGTTAAIHAARAGHDVHIFEKRGALLQSASGINQYRLHRGYHYPRSPETVESVIAAEELFIEEYGESLVAHGRNIYGVAREGSKTAPEAFLAFCERHNLAFKEIDGTGLVNAERVPLCLEVEESWYDPSALRAMVEKRVREAGISVHLGEAVKTEDLADFDKVIVAAYAGMNEVLPANTESYQFELCEKPVVSLSKEFGLTGIVVVDGPFMCVDPLGSTGNFVLGNVVHAIHTTAIGRIPDIPPELASYVDAGIVHNPIHSKFDLFIETGKEYIPILKEAKHLGSMFTVRTVLPNLDKTDARPTIVTAVDERVIKIFSGKVGNCVDAARKATELI